MAMRNRFDDVEFKVTQEIIDRAVREGRPGSWLIEEAIRQALPGATDIKCDGETISFVHNHKTHSIRSH